MYAGVPKQMRQVDCAIFLPLRFEMSGPHSAWCSQALIRLAKTNGNTLGFLS